MFNVQALLYCHHVFYILSEQIAWIGCYTPHIFTVLSTDSAFIILWGVFSFIFDVICRSDWTWAAQIRVYVSGLQFFLIIH